MADSLLDIGSESIFPLEINWAKRPEYNLSLARVLMQFPGTASKVISYVDDVPERLTIGVSTFNKNDEYTLIDFFNSHKGCHGRFWIKVPQAEFTLKETALSGTTSLSVYRNGAEQQYQGYERIWILMSNGDVLTRHVLSITDDEANDRYLLALESATDREINTSNHVLIGRLLLVRFDHDDLSMDYFTDSAEEVVLKVVELVKEYSEI